MGKAYLSLGSNVEPGRNLASAVHALRRRFGDLVLDGPGDFQLPRPELRHAFVLKPLADVAPDFVDPVRGTTLSALWDAHPQRHEPFIAQAL